MNQNLFSEVITKADSLCFPETPPVGCEYHGNLPLTMPYMVHFHFSDQTSVLTVWAGLFPVLGLAASMYWCSGADMTRYHKYRSLTHRFAICVPDGFKLSCMVFSGVHCRQGLWFSPQVWPLPPNSWFWKN